MTVEHGRIICCKKGLFTLACDTGKYACKAATRLRREKTEPLVGDEAEFENNGDGTGFITSILPRKNSFERPHIANVDVLVVVAATANPAPDLFCIDKLTSAAYFGGAETALAISKTDIADGDRLSAIYKKSGYEVFMINDDAETARLSVWLRGRTAVFTGASGVGKSSLLNRLCPGIHAETGELSLKIERGKNTTRHTELYDAGERTYIADTPGFSSVDTGNLKGIEPDKLIYAFPEFLPYITRCRYRSCTHLREESCAVLSAAAAGEIAVSRVESYAKLYTELKNNRY